MKSWREMITRLMKWNKENWNDVVSCTLSDEELDVEFDTDFGAINGKPFTLWTKERVYFPVQYDGKEWVSYVSRNPDGISTSHVGDC